MEGWGVLSRKEPALRESGEPSRLGVRRQGVSLQGFLGPPQVCSSPLHPWSTLEIQALVFVFYKSFIEIQFMHHKIHPFKVCNAVVIVYSSYATITTILE